MPWLYGFFICFDVLLIISCLRQKREANSSSVTDNKRGAIYDVAQEALQYVENVRTATSCDGGTSNILNVRFDNSEWKSQANAAVRLSNLLTKNWLETNNTGGCMDDVLLFAMTRTTIEIETLAFGSAIAFEPYFYRNMSKFCAYSFHITNTTIKSHDISVEYDYFPSEWYSFTKEKAKNLTSIFQSNVTLRLSEYDANGTKIHRPMTHFVEPVANIDDGFWTRPYFDCGGGDIWMITFNSPIFGIINNSLDFAGVATCDIALNILDIDQCDAQESAKKAALNVFRGTHHCKPSTKCVPRLGFGFRRGTYYCFCRPGYYFPDTTATVKAFPGFDVEDAYATWFLNGTLWYHSDFDCVSCPEGCDTCEDATPCLAVWNWVVRGILLGIVFLMMTLVCILTALVVRFRRHPVLKSASPVFLLVTCAGGILVTVKGIALCFRPSVTSCCIRIWFEHVGFALIYGPLLLKNWRIAAIFTIQGGKRVQLSDSGLLRRLSIIVIPVVTYLIVWTVISSPVTTMVVDGTGLKFYMCKEGWMDYGVVIAECVFLLWGVYLCYQIRNVVSSFNESKLIAWTIYNTIFMKNFLMIIRIFMIGKVGPDVLYVMYILELQVVVTCTFGIIFGPKLFLIRKIIVAPGNPQTGTVYNIDTMAEEVPKQGFVSKLDHRF